MNRSREEVVELLSHRGVQLTAQRIAIAQFVLNSTEHPSAEDVFQAVSGTLPLVSKATVYNTLNLLVRQGLLIALKLQGGGVRYDPLLSPHSHFLDTQTNRLVDICPTLVEVVQHRLDPERFEVEEIQVIFRGRVRDCVSKYEPAVE
jgi:Fe2+ or Zn2+ uptake regulation protein